MVELMKLSVFSTFFGGIFYGFSVLLYILAVWILIGTRRTHGINYPMLSTSCILMALSTTEITLIMVRIYQGFISIGPSLPGGPDQYFENNDDLTMVAKNCLYNAQSIVFDAVVIYRTYVVWRSSIVVILPIISWCGLLAASIGTNLARANQMKHATDLFAVQTDPWITSTYALDLGTNFLATGLLALRIWTVSCKTAQYRESGSGLTPFLRVVIESGVIYSITITVGLVLFLLKSDAVYIVADVTSPIISIVCNMIVVRLGLANECKKHCCVGQDQGQSGQISSSGFVAVTRPKTRGHRAGLNSFELEMTELGVTLKITQLARNGNDLRVSDVDANGRAVKEGEDMEVERE